MKNTESSTLSRAQAEERARYLAEFMMPERFDALCRALDSTRVRALQPSDHAQQARFAAARRTHNGDALAGGKTEGHIAQYAEIAVAERDVFEFKHFSRLPISVSARAFQAGS